MKTIKQEVSRILEVYPHCTDDDTALFKMLVTLNYCNNEEETSMFCDIIDRLDFAITAPSRYRSHFQNKENKYLPSKEILEKRQNHRVEKQREFSPSLG